MIEMLVVITVLGIAAVVVIPNFLQLVRQARLTSAANQIASLVQQTRMRAIRDRQEYAVGIDGAKIVGRGLLDSGVVGDDRLEIEFEDDRMAVFPPGPPGESSTADCLARAPAAGVYDDDNVTYDSLGLASKTLAVCISDGRGNVLQVALEFPNGQPKVKKFLPAGAAPGAEGFYENVSAATTGSTWTWY